MNAIITGATKGIGLAITNLLAEKGYNLILNSRSSEDLEDLKNRLKEKNSILQIEVFAADMGSKSEVLKFGDFCNAQFETFEVLVNNAGVFIPGETHKEEDGVLEKMIETNLYSAYYLSQKLIPKMIDQGKGHIFNMCSIASKIAYPNGGSYSISKFALLGFSKVLREELKDKGIKVTSILPGATWSNSWKGVELPESRLMQANDIALAVWNAIQMSPSAVVEEIILRPQLGDL